MKTVSPESYVWIESNTTPKMEVRTLPSAAASFPNSLPSEAKILKLNCNYGCLNSRYFNILLLPSHSFQR